MGDSNPIDSRDGGVVKIHHYMPTPSESKIPLPPIPSSLSQGTQRTAAHGGEQQQPAVSSIEARVTQEVTGMSKPALLGYTTGLLIFLFGCLGTMFNDNPDIGGIKKAIASGYLVAAVTLVQISSIADNTWRSSQRE
ncbi:hypothetical protein [Synechococcus sp. CC9311]|uniref:hypothetical protein n=1 Tax=Synechococcus sp. (strain CC9311) TaxID=64471 RepID=UPI0000DDAC3B|nr:hypothetical protein [Synechococcus sp. CC9311]ABI45457.1 hypothetical protein sync_0836 [Synechococcus sp. CC9311]